MSRGIWPAVLLLAGACAGVAGEALDLRVTTDRSVDPTSFETIAQSVCKPGMSEKEKALALWQFFNTSVYHWDHIGGGWDVLCTYGYGLCGTQWRTYCQLYPTAMGPGTVRGGGLSGWAANPEALRILSRGWLVDTWLMSNKEVARDEMYRPPDPVLIAAKGPENNGGHTMGEVKFDNTWHYMDIHAGFYVYTADGKAIASLDQVRSDPSLVSDPVNVPPRFMPCDGGTPHFFYRVKGDAGGAGGGEPDRAIHATNLRAGLRHIRYYGKTFPGAYAYNKSWERMPAWYREKGPRHLCNNEEGWRHHGNGEIVFEPEAAALWREAVVKSDNLAADPEGGLRGADPQKAFSLTVEFQTPHVFVAETIRGAVTGDVTITRGATPVWKSSGAESAVAVTPGAENRSLGGSLAYAIAGGPGASIRKLRLAPIFQYNYFVSPRPKPGENRVKVTWSDKSRMEGRAVRATWTWNEKAGEKRDERTIATSGTEYGVTVGPVDILPDADANPTYVEALTLEVVAAP